MTKKVIIFLCLAFVFPLVLKAQWRADSTTNVAVCTAAGNQQSPKICTDGDNGAIICWQDYRAGRWDIYAQRIDKNGYAKWKADGVLVSDGVNFAQNPIVCPDGSGGAYIVWEDQRKLAKYGLKLYGQLVKSDGTMAYVAGGQALCDTVYGPQQKAAICIDGSGNAFVAWEDSRTSISPQASRPDIYMNKMTSGAANSWGKYGLAVITQAGHQNDIRLVDDGQGGCLLAWTTNFGAPPISLWGTRINSGGGVMWGYQGAGVLIYKGDWNTKNAQNPVLSRDGNQFIVAWEEPQIDNVQGLDILVNRLNLDSTKVWFSPATPTPSYIGDQAFPIAFSDNAGGVLVAYQSATTTKDVGITRILSDGITIAPNNGQPYPVCNLTNDQSLPVAVKTADGMLLAWNDERAAAGQSSIYAQRCDVTPTRKLWPSGSTVASRWGVSISVSASGVTKDQVTMTSRTNGAIIAWHDSRNSATKYDIYAQLIFIDGSLPIELAGFSLKKYNGAVSIDWQTAMEKDNAGFEIERRNITDPHSDNRFNVVASYRTNAALRGAANSNYERNYSYLDVPNAAGVYEYRLVDYALDGSLTHHEIKSIEIGEADMQSGWNVEPNSPNPFRDNTFITFSSPVRAIVDMEVYDVLGRVVTSPMKSEIVDAGVHRVSLRSSELGVKTGTFYYSITARDAETGNVIWKMPKAAMMFMVQ